jgi:two-component system phosphate regulon response regulator OmpR
MLPGIDGLEVARRLRDAGDVPILMLTARGSTADRVRGFALGADDYLPKPFAPAEMIARVRAILRRGSRAAPPERRLRHRELEVDLDRREVTLGGAPVALSNAELRLLVALIEADGRVLTRDALLDILCGPDADGVMERSVDVYIGRLRAKLADDVAGPAYVATVRGVGYRLAP